MSKIFLQPQQPMNMETLRSLKASENTDPVTQCRYIREDLNRNNRNEFSLIM